MARKVSPNDFCPCDSGKKYKKCCRIYHSRQQKPPTPEALVRARYAAYALGEIDFIIQTTHPESPHYGENSYRWRASLESYSFRNLFSGLKILSAEEDRVTYQATIFALGAYDQSFIENAVFKLLDGHWLYYDGEYEDIDAEAEA